MWHYRHVFPDVARRWFAPSAGDGVPFAKARAKLGDPVAMRHVAADHEAERAEEDWPIEAVTDPAALDRRHKALLEWARTDHHWSGPQVDMLRDALKMGWRDVAEAMEANPYMLAGLLTRERRSDQFDEPGMLMARDFVLVWSRLAPSRFLARLLATASSTDLVTMAEDASRRSAMGKPEVAKNLPTTIPVYKTWWKDLQPALAIAWMRCRRELVRTAM